MNGPAEPDSITVLSTSGHSGVEAVDAPRFAPGALVADRYRIVGLLGTGGMGEVYRADDLKLNHPVALSSCRCAW
ncbi:MAG: hypothetical protein H0W08_10430 [Acidobacteria bacterium]|nr:hypothetical protein [Acidobacteriota bacterium]